MKMRNIGSTLIAAILVSGCSSAVESHNEPAARQSEAVTTLSIPNQMPSIIAIDKTNLTVTLPLRRGRGPDGRAAYFILTDTSDLAEAVRLGINWSPKLTNALGTAAVQSATVHGDDDSELSVGFSGGVDFRPVRVVVPGPDLYPLGDGTQPGSVGDSKYSPLITGGNGIVYNAPQLANATGVHDKVLSIDYENRQVTLRLTPGFYNHRDVLYISTDSSVPPVAALEAATYAPNLAVAPEPGVDDPSISAREPIIPVVNGPMGVTNPERQGLRSAVAGEGPPLNIIREEPECSDPNVPANCSALQYSPLWDVHPVVWTQAAIDAGLRTRITAHQDAESLFNAGDLVNGAPNGPSNQDPEIRGLRAAGVIVNCPPMFVAP
jgi:hypothetical protein